MEITGTCPYCNETYVTDENRETIFCTNCGKKIQVKEWTDVTCPECQHRVKIHAGRKVAFCPDCGTKLVFEDEDQDIYHSRDKIAAKMTDKALDRRQQMKIEKMRNRTALKIKKMETKDKRGLSDNATSIIGLIIGFGVLFILPFLMKLIELLGLD